MAEFLTNPDAYSFAPEPSPPSSPASRNTRSPSLSEGEPDTSWRVASDPYSANANATQSPLIHTRTKRQADNIPPTPSSSVASYCQRSPTRAPRPSLPTPMRPRNRYSPIQDPVWEEALDEAFLDGVLVIQLDNSDVAVIPPEIIDLNHIVTLPSETPTSTYPPPIQPPETPTPSAIASTAARSRRIHSQSRSNNTLFSGSPTKLKRDLQLYLANNKITILPSELFGLKDLTLLSLRGNKLRELPPAIANLRSLRSLNIANNELTYLPAEISYLKLQTLLLDPNPFPPQPAADSAPGNRVGSSNGDSTRGIPMRVLGPLEIYARIPTLAELALRVALRPKYERSKITPLSFANNLGRVPQSSTISSRSPLTPPDSHSSIFTSSPRPPPLPRSAPGPGLYNSRSFFPHALAISDYYDTNSWLPETLPNASVYITAVMQGTEDARNIYSWCPGRKHREDKEETSGLFVRPAEKRLEWVTTLAGCELSSAVPILWRGCSAGCLDFLEEGVRLAPGNQRECDEDEEFMTAFGSISRDREPTLSEDQEEAAVEAQTQIVWDDIMKLDE
ncbi:hypothetical protein CTheo_1763 [Ceratobasidium theobromae]|uniref:Uncharacterized protein n=1 Tax=Ceratobasidium theobromae TaxID=1582974 RepID=A0A5N5QSX3_9AGAM|nr:hypothetical protein CTheo_1763 [Ceratobasidium theobromae]